MVAHPLAPVRGSDRLVVATSQTGATKPRRPPPCRSRPRASAAPLSVVRPFALASNESSDTCVLPFASQINHALSTPAYNRPFEAEVIFGVQGAISPLLANLLLDEVDKELEGRGHAFVRYADDLIVYVRTQRSGERVMISLRKLFAKLKLRVNETKSKVTRATASKFLGFSFWTAKGRTIRRRVAPQAIARMKERVRELTRRSAGRSLAQICKPLGVYLKGWKAYFRLPQTPSVFADLDGWVRHRLRAVQLKHWKRGPVIYREMTARGMSHHEARQVATNVRRWWYSSPKGLHIAH